MWLEGDPRCGSREILGVWRVDSGWVLGVLSPCQIVSGAIQKSAEKREWGGGLWVVGRAPLDKLSSGEGPVGEIIL